VKRLFQVGVNGRDFGTSARQADITTSVSAQVDLRPTINCFPSHWRQRIILFTGCGTSTVVGFIFYISGGVSRSHRLIAQHAR